MMVCDKCWYRVASERVTKCPHCKCRLVYEPTQDVIARKAAAIRARRLRQMRGEDTYTSDS
jgi:hypothetical protein